jgi:hypothetical protein
MMTLLALLVSDKHAGLGKDLQLLTSLKIGKARILDFILFNIVIFKSSLTLIQVPKLFLGFLSKVKFGVLEILFVD